MYCTLDQPSKYVAFQFAKDKAQVYDREAPTRDGAKHTPSFVRILCTLFVDGLTHAASLELSVIKPASVH